MDTCISLVAYFSGYNLGIDMIDPLVIRHEQRSYETGNSGSSHEHLNVMNRRSVHHASAAHLEQPESGSL